MERDTRSGHLKWLLRVASAGLSVSALNHAALANRRDIRPRSV